MLTVKIISSLDKIFRNKNYEFTEITSLSMLKNEKLNFQLYIASDEDIKISVDVESEINHLINLYTVKDVPVGTAFNHSDDYIISNESGDYPDLLVPLSGEFNAEKDCNFSIWAEICGDGITYGNKIITFKVNDETVSITVEIINNALPEQELIYTNWYHADCLCNYYKIKPFSDEFWRINENFIRTAAEHGQNCILTPLFTPPLDTFIGGERTTVQLVKVKIRGGTYAFDFRNLKKWTELCKRSGIKYFEMSHLFTQWGAKHAPKIVAYDRKGREKKIFGWFTKTSSKKYDDFIRCFGKALSRFIDENNLSNNVFFHISDEPSVQHLKVYKKRAALIKEVFGKYPVMDAMSDYDFYEKGAVDIPVPCENSFENFYGKVDKVWTYYCCGQCEEYVPNRFIAMPSARNRISGIILYRYNVLGFLQWGYNFYNSQYSKSEINPFEVTDAGGAFPAGDSFIVYPAKDGTAYSSLRQKVFYDGIQDISALKLLEKEKGRDFVMNIIGNISMKNYPHGNDYILSVRNKVNEEISHISDFD